MALTIGPNGGGAYVNQYTFVMDLLVPGPLDWVALANTDPWGKNWNYSGSFADTNTPANQNEMGVCSTGPAQTPTDSFCVANFNQVYTGAAQPNVDGSVGYSSIYGSWQGKA